MEAMAALCLVESQAGVAAVFEFGNQTEGLVHVREVLYH
jgi:hypothetical protein